MPLDDIRAIELRRLHEQEKKVALLGPNTPPEVLIEIQELRTKYPDAPRNGHRNGRRSPIGRAPSRDEFDYLINTVTAGLKRITGIEERQTSADESRQQLDDKLDQVLYGVGELRRWSRAIAGVAVVALVIAILLAVKVF